MTLPRSPLWIAVVVAVVIGLAAGGTWAYNSYINDSYKYKGGVWEPPNPAPALNLTDQEGQAFTLDSLRGKVVLVFFGYTNCPDFCPTTMLEVQTVKEHLGEQASDVAVLFVTMDPARDTPQRLDEYLGFFDESFIGLSGTTEQTNDIKRTWNVVGQADEPDENGRYLVNHTTTLFAIDTDGNLALQWLYGTASEDIASDIEHLLS